jgi:biotin carboxyl carrier protein
MEFSYLDTLTTTLVAMAIFFSLLVTLMFIIKFQSFILSFLARNKVKVDTVDIINNEEEQYDEIRGDAIEENLQIVAVISAALSAYLDQPQSNLRIKSIKRLKVRRVKMKQYNVKVNGITYEVEVEEINGESSISNTPVAITEQTPVKVEPLAKAQGKKMSGTGEKIECPMPGTVLTVNVSPGDDIKKGHVMFILEAMKMENEIMAPRDAKIIEVSVVSGATVNTGDVLAVIE